MADNTKNDKNKNKNKDRNQGGEQKKGSQGGRSSYEKGENEQKDSWVLDDESMEDR